VSGPSYVRSDETSQFLCQDGAIRPRHPFLESAFNLDLRKVGVVLALGDGRHLVAEGSGPFDTGRVRGGAVW